MKQKPVRRDPEQLYSEGSQHLIEAIVRQAAKDYLHAARLQPKKRGLPRMRETTAFFLSDYFLRLTGTRGDLILEKLKKEAKRK